MSAGLDVDVRELAQLDEHVRRVVDAAPPLTDEASRHLAALLLGAVNPRPQLVEAGAA